MQNSDTASGFHKPTAMTPRFAITYFIDLCSLSLEDLLPGEGRWVVITGGNRGIGFEAVQMFLEHGSFESLEIRIKKKHIESQSRAKSGGWYTKGQLEGQHQWTKTQPQFCKMLWKLPYRLMHFYQIPILGTKENGGTCLSMGRAK